MAGIEPPGGGSSPLIPGSGLPPVGSEPLDGAGSPPEGGAGSVPELGGINAVPPLPDVHAASAHAIDAAKASRGFMAA